MLALLGECIFESINSPDNLLTVRECVEKALDISKLPYSAQDIKQRFDLSSERFDRNLQYVSGEIWKISIAVGFALNRDVFCYPWMNTQDLRAFFDPQSVEMLKQNEKIVLLPTCRTTLKSPYSRFLEHCIDFHKVKSRYFDICPEDRKKISKIKGW